MPDTSDLPFREVPYLPLKLEIDRRPDGTIYLDNGQPLKACPPHMLAALVHWAEHRPDTVWLAERDPENPGAEGWNTITYAVGLDTVRRLAQGFLDAGAGPDAPLMILSKNSIA
ncbi:MAG TPA: feruloyl-CoA synthase, partial [Hyphomonas sp.]|nr:feruloyl-CoA synthase [Hyphomonas sp.]